MPWARATRAWAVAMGLLVLATVAAAAEDAVAPLRVMSFNVRVDLASDGPNAWQQRRDRVASMIRFHRVDLVGLQESLRTQVDDLVAALPGFGWLGTGRAADGGGELCAILYRKDRLELIEHGTRWLSETPLVPGSRGWDAAYLRIVTWAAVRDRRTGIVFHHVNTHLDNAGEVARLEGARLIRATIEEIAGGSPVVVTGDFNSLAGDPPWRALTERHGSGRGPELVDAMEVSRAPHHGPTSTWNGFQAIEPRRRIDFILVSRTIDVLAHGILSDTFDGWFPSDHLPVLAEIVLHPAP